MLETYLCGTMSEGAKPQVRGVWGACPKSNGLAGMNSWFCPPEKPFSYDTPFQPQCTINHHSICHVQQMLSGSLGSSLSLKLQ